MFRKTSSLLLVVATIILAGFTGEAYASSIYNINVRDNLLAVNSSNYQGKRIMVESNGERYFYTFTQNEEIIPLSFGKNNYTVRVLENIDGNRYKVLYSQDIKVDTNIDNNIFLASAQPVTWSKGDKASTLAEELTKNAKSDVEKVTIIYDYIVNNIKYDYEKINRIKNNYVPNNNKTLESLDGICYDYSALFAAMLRSQNIPTKLIKGYRAGLDEYHAWNQVYLDGKWVTIDTTYSAAYVQKNRSVEMIQNSSLYTVERQY